MEYTSAVQIFLKHLNFCSYVKYVKLGVRKLSCRKICENKKEKSSSFGGYVSP